MRTATPATGKCSRQPLLPARASEGAPIPPPRKTVAQTRPAPLATRSTQRPIARRGSLPLDVTMLHPRSNRHCVPTCLAARRVATPPRAKFNRQPARLEIAISPTKQTPATQFNRQLCATPRIAPFASRLPRGPHRGPKGMPSRGTFPSPQDASGPRITQALLDTNGRFRRNNNSPNSFKTNDRVNSYSIQTAPLVAKRVTALPPF